MKRVPVYLSVEEMQSLLSAMDLVAETGEELEKYETNLMERLAEEIERNTEPTGSSDE
jgi:hypothetical protein